MADPWAVRNEYISVLIDRSEENIDAFIIKQAKRELKKGERVHLFRLLEMQRNAILMFSSCGWFFDEISGLETTQILQYACRALHYAQQVTDVNLEEEFIYRLSQAPSNLSEFGDGGGVYEKNVKPAHVDLMRVGMHYAASSLFEEYPDRLEFFNYIATSESFERIEAGNQVIVVGRATVRSKITHSEKHFSFAVLYLGQLNIIGNISLDMDKEAFEIMVNKVKTSFLSVDLAGVIGAFQQHFGPEKFTIWQLFKEEKQRIINAITAKRLEIVEDSFRKIYKDNYQLMSGLLVSGVAVPDAYKSAVQYVLNIDLKKFFLGDSLRITELKNILDKINTWGVPITDENAFKLAASERIYSEIKLAEANGIPLSRVQSLNNILIVLNEMKIKPNSWKSQTLYFNLLKEYQSVTRSYPSSEWEKAFLQLGDLLDVKTK